MVRAELCLGALCTALASPDFCASRCAGQEGMGCCKYVGASDGCEWCPDGFVDGNSSAADGDAALNCHHDDGSCDGWNWGEACSGKCSPVGPAPSPPPSPTPPLPTGWSTVGQPCFTHSDGCELCSGIPMDNGHGISGGCKVIGGFELQPRASIAWEALADGTDECNSEVVKDVAGCQDMVSKAKSATINVVSYWSPNACDMGYGDYSYVRFYSCTSMPTLDGESDCIHIGCKSSFHTVQRGLSSSHQTVV